MGAYTAYAVGCFPGGNYAHLLFQYQMAGGVAEQNQVYAPIRAVFQYHSQIPQTRACHRNVVLRVAIRGFFVGVLPGHQFVVAATIYIPHFDDGVQYVLYPIGPANARFGGCWPSRHDGGHIF